MAFVGSHFCSRAFWQAMDKASQYRSYAEAAVGFASRSTDSAYKAIMLKVAQGWLDLSLLAEKRATQAELWMLADERARPNRQPH